METDLAAMFTGEPAKSQAIGLGDELRSLVGAGATAWPEVRLDAAIFVRHLAERTERNRAVLGSIHGLDLYLACACGHGDVAAVRELHRGHLARVPDFLSRMRPSPELCEDVRQTTGELLLVSAGGAPPKILDYAGRGSLSAWLRIVVVRVALRLRQRAQGHEEVGDAVAQLLESAVSPELDLLRRRYAGEFTTALRAAFARLSPDQRLVLRLSWLEGLTGDQIASALRIHRATVVRWIAGAREDILREATRHFREKTGASDSELDSLVGVLRSCIDVTLSQLLGATPA